MVSGLLFFGTGIKSKFFKYISMALLLLWAIKGSYWVGTTSIVFAIINLIVLMSVAFINTRITNKYFSAFSMLLYSVVIDIICYFIFPVSTNIFSYILSGISFNLKNVVIPFLIVCVYDIVCYFVNARLKKENKATN